MPRLQGRYRCLTCGTYEVIDHGGYTEWYWWSLDYGAIGPFCSAEHACAFRTNLTPSRGATAPEPAFTLAEHARLAHLRQRYEEGSL